MKNKSFIIFGFISFVLVLILFFVVIEYKIETKKADDTFNSGIIYIDNQKIKLPIKITDFENKFKNIKFKSEYYDEQNYFYYNSQENKFNYLSSQYTTEGILTIDNYDIGVFISNLDNEKNKISNCYITGIRLSDNQKIKLFENISLNMSYERLNKILKTGKLNIYKEEYPNLLKYKKDYIIEITYDIDKITDIIYYFDYEKCKEKSCDIYLN